MADDVNRQSIDWEAIEATPEFQELVSKRRSFVIPATIFFLAWYMGFILLAAYAEGFMSARIYEGLTVGYTLALTQFVMVVVLGLMYLRRSEKVYDPLAEKAIAPYVDQHGEGAPAPHERPEGTPAPATGSRAATR